jgi:nitrilase
MTRVAAIQMNSGADVAANLEQAGRFLAQAARAGARLAALPENFACMPARSEAIGAVAEDNGHGPIQEFLAAQARTHKLWLVGGTVPLRAAQDKVYASCLVFDPEGRRAARYDKMHLFDVDLAGGESYRESAQFAAGERVVVCETTFGRLGLAVCYDLRFPELFRAMAADGVDLIALPSAFTAQTGRAHWEVLVRARAIENFAYVIAPGQCGRHASGRTTHGDSMVVSPWGEVLDRLPAGSGYAIAEIDSAELTRVRQSLPSLRHRRLGA